MSETHRKKLNLKALQTEQEPRKTNEPESVLEEDQKNDTHETFKASAETSEKPKQEGSKSEKAHSETAAPKNAMKISLSDIKRAPKKDHTSLPSQKEDNTQKKTDSWPALPWQEDAPNMTQSEEKSIWKKEENTQKTLHSTEEKEPQKQNENINAKEETSSPKKTTHLATSPREDGTKKEQKQQEKKGFFSKLFQRKKKTNPAEKTNTQTQDTEIHFKNYTSDFEKKSRNIFKRVQNFRYTPRTRKTFVLGMIWVTCIGIFGLMFFFPDKHGVDVYKASILSIVSKEQESPKIQEKIPKTPENDSDKTPITPPWETTQTTNEAAETKQHEGKSNEEIRKEKLKNYLLDRYKK